MNTLIKTLPLALLLALAGGAAAADPPTEPAATPAPAPRMAARHMDPAAMTERMTRHLGLSPEQAREVEQINERFATQVEEHRKQAESMRAAHREAVHKIGAQRDAELKKVLSEEQFRKHAEQKQMMQERRREHGGPGGKGPRPPAGTTPPPPAQ
jgi:periplasmic protein CpxP/Spy